MEKWKAKVTVTQQSWSSLSWLSDHDPETSSAKLNLHHWPGQTPTQTPHPKISRQPTVTSIHPRSVPKPPPSVTSKRKARSRPTPTQPRQAEPGQTPTAVGILGPRPLPTSDHIIWEEAGLLPPSSVWVRPQTPTTRGGDAQIIPPNTEEQWQRVDPKTEKSLEKQRRHLHIWHDDRYLCF